MISFQHIFTIAVISASFAFTMQNPVLVSTTLWTWYVDTFHAFSLNQWKVIVPLLIMAFLNPWLTRWYIRRTRFQYDGRRLRAEALGVTSEDRTVAINSDESNQASNTGTSKLEVTMKQKQVAPNLNDDITLSKRKMEEPYSYTMYLGQYQFASTNVLNDTIFYIESTQIFTNNNFKRLFVDRRFAKFDVQYTINITGNPMATGILAIASLPYNTILPSSLGDQDSTTVYTWVNLYDRILSSNHVLCDVSVDGVYKVDQPYTFRDKYLSYFNYAQPAVVPPWAALCCTVVSPYLPPTGTTTSINVEVYANLINVEYMDTAPYNAQGLVLKEPKSALLERRKAKFYQAQGFLDFSTNTTIIEQKLDHVENASLPTELSGDHITASVPASAMLDCPPDPRNAGSSVFRMAYQKLFSFMNVVDVWKTSSTPKEEAVFDKKLSEELRIDVDEMSIDFFRGRWYSPTNTNVVVPFTTSTTTGTRLAVYDMCPIPLAGPFSNNFTSTNTGDFTQWLTSFFRYWRGSMRFRIVVASNAFKRGKILVCLNYGGDSSTLPTTITSGQLDPRSLPHMIIDLSNKDRFVDIDVPYKAVREYMRMPNITNNVVSAGGVYNEMSMGTIAIYAVSPLQVTNGTSTSVNINVFQAWGHDYEMFSPQQIAGVGYCSQARLEPGGPNTISTISRMMIPTDSIQQLARTRPSFVGQYYFQTGSTPGGANIAPAVIPIHPIFQTTDPLWSGIVAAYAGMRGGYRLTVRFTNISTTGTSFKLQYYDSMVPQNGLGVNWNTSAGQTFDTTNLTGPNNTYVADQSVTIIPSMNLPLQTQYPVYINNIAPSVAGSVRTYGIQPTQEIIVDPYSQPEVIIEVPDPSPTFRSQQMLRIPQNYNFANVGAYSPYKDRNIGMLVIVPMDNNPIVYEPNALVASCQVTMTAADDWRAFWYNGGPTTIFPYTVGATGTTTTYSYFNPAGR
jgi:hypothetical protein